MSGAVPRYDAVVARLTFDTGYTDSQAFRTAFAGNFAKWMSVAAEVEASRVQVDTVSEGSVIVDFKILPPATSGHSAQQALVSLRQVLEPGVEDAGPQPLAPRLLQADDATGSSGCPCIDPWNDTDDLVAAGSHSHGP